VVSLVVVVGDEVPCPISRAVSTAAATIFATASPTLGLRWRPNAAREHSAMSVLFAKLARDIGVQLGAPIERRGNFS